MPAAACQYHVTACARACSSITWPWFARHHSFHSNRLQRSGSNKTTTQNKRRFRAPRSRLDSLKASLSTSCHLRVWAVRRRQTTSCHARVWTEPDSPSELRVDRARRQPTWCRAPGCCTRAPSASRTPARPAKGHTRTAIHHVK
eukprot:2262302-Rhodomonas_salina.1